MKQMNNNLPANNCFGTGRSKVDTFCIFIILSKHAYLYLQLWVDVLRNAIYSGDFTFKYPKKEKQNKVY